MFDFIFHINLKETKQMRTLFSIIFAGIAVCLKPMEPRMQKQAGSLLIAGEGKDVAAPDEKAP